MQGLLYVNPAAKKNQNLLKHVLPGLRHMYWPLPDSFSALVKREVRASKTHVSLTESLSRGFQALKLLNDRAAFAKTVGMISPLEDARSTRFHGACTPAAPITRSEDVSSPALLRVGGSPAPGMLLVSHPMHAHDSRHRKVVLILEHDSRGNSQQGSLGVGLNAEQLTGYLKGDWFARTKQGQTSDDSEDSGPPSDGMSRGGAYHAPLDPPAWQMGPGATVSHNSLPASDVSSSLDDSTAALSPPHAATPPPLPATSLEATLHEAGPPAFSGGPLQVPVFFVHTRSDVGGTPLPRPWWSGEPLAPRSAAGGQREGEGGDSHAADCAGQPLARAVGPAAAAAGDDRAWAAALAAGQEIHTNGDKDAIQDRIDAGQWDPKDPHDGAAFFSSVYSWRIGALKEELARGEWLVVEHSDPWQLVQEHVLQADASALHTNLQHASPSSDWRSFARTRSPATQGGGADGSLDSVEGGGNDAVWRQVLLALGGEYACLTRMPDSFIALHPAAPEEYRPDPEVAFRQQLEWEARFGGEGGGSALPFGDDTVQLTEIAPGVYVAVQEADLKEGSDGSDSDSSGGGNELRGADALTAGGGEEGRHLVAEKLQELIRRKRSPEVHNSDSAEEESSSDDSSSDDSSSDDSSSDDSSSDDSSSDDSDSNDGEQRK